MPFNYNDRHDLQEEERRRQEARINERVTLLTNPQNIQQNSRIQTTRRHPQNIRDSLPSRGGKRTKRRIEDNIVNINEKVERQSIQKYLENK